MSLKGGEGYGRSVHQTHIPVSGVAVTWHDGLRTCRGTSETNNGPVELKGKFVLFNEASRAH